MVASSASAGWATSSETTPTTEYDASTVGIAGTRGSNFTAFNNCRKSAFLTEIIALVHSENPVTAAYALTALHTRDRPTFDRLSKLFLADEHTFTERSGCLVSSGYPLVAVIRMRFATIDTQGPNRLLAEAAFLLMTRTPQSTKRFANTAYAYNRSFNLLNESLFRHAAATQPDRALLMAEHYLPTRDYDGSIRLWAQSRGSDGRFRVAELIDEIEDPILFAHLTDWLIADGRPHWVEPLLQRFSKRDDHRITFAILHLALRLDPTKTRRFVAQWLADNEATQQAKATLVQRFLAVDDPGR